MPPKGSRKEPSTAPALKFTSFGVIGFLNGKNVAANYVKTDSQSWFSRRTSDVEWDQQREGKRRRLMASEEEILEKEKELPPVLAKDEDDEDGEQGEQQPKVKINVLKNAPQGAVRPPKVKEPEIALDPLHKTIVIHPGSTWLRIGRASDAFPSTIPNVIARKSRTFVPSTSNEKGKQRADAPAPPRVVPAAMPSLAAFNSLPPLPSSHNNTVYQEDDDDLSMNSDSDDQNSSTMGDDDPSDPTVPLDPLSAKINSIRGDLRVRMRAFKLRGQGNGNAQAAAYNATVVPDATADFNDPGEIEWTKTEGKEAEEVYVGLKALRIPDPEESGYLVRRPYARNGFNTTGYTSHQELLGDIEKIYLTVLEEEYEIVKSELKDYSVILIIPDLYDHIYIREMTDLLLKWIGFKQLCLEQESVCTTFGAGISTACVIDIGAKLSKITCVEEGLVLPETRMVLDFGGDDITQFLHTLLSRNNFPYQEADLMRWYDFTVLEDLKERLVVLSEADVGLNLYDFHVRVPGRPTRKYQMRVYDDCILAPYALFAPRVVDFDSKRTTQPVLWSKNVEDVIDIGGNAVTNAMKASTRHLLPATPSLPALGGTVTGADSSAAPSPSATPAPDDLPSLPSLPALPPAAPPSDIDAPPPPQPKQISPVKLKTSSSSSSQSTPKINVRVESSKIPLDVAVVESILAAGAEDRMKKICQNVVVVGGTGLIHNIGFAVQSRVAPQLSIRQPSLAGQLAIVPPPRDIDPQILAWKGIAVLNKLESANDLWIRAEDWETLGMRAVRERAFYFS